MSLSKEIRKFPVRALYPTLFESKMGKFEKSPKHEEWLEWARKASAATEDEFRPLSSFCSLYYPNCQDIMIFEVLFKLSIAITVEDDRAESDFNNTDLSKERSLKIITQLSQMVSKLEKKEFVSMIDWDPSVIAVYACLDTIYEAFNETQRKRLITLWRFHTLSLIEEYKLVRQIKPFSSVEEMIALRVNSSGIFLFIQWIEYSDQIYVPEQIREDSRLVKLERLVAQHFCTLNDFVGFEKDYNFTNGNLNTMNNTIAFLVVIKGLSIEDAMKEVVEMIKQLEEDITRIGSELLNEENCLDVTKKYINSLYYTAGGAYKAMIGSKRHQN